MFFDGVTFKKRRLEQLPRFEPLRWRPKSGIHESKTDRPRIGPGPRKFKKSRTNSVQKMKSPTGPKPTNI